MTKIFKNTIARDLQDKMKKVTVPTLMIWGQDDNQTPVADAQIIHELINNSQLHILKGTHFVHQEKPEEITNMILEFIKI
jgi:3-oxoadipate enol-lactonase